MILDDIKSKLQTVDENVYYGLADRNKAEDEWNYIVFNRRTSDPSPNKTGYSDYFDVAIVREDYIPEGIDEQVISAMTEIKGMRLTSEGGEYGYTRKGNTNAVVELLVLHFVRARRDV